MRIASVFLAVLVMVCVYSPKAWSGEEMVMHLVVVGAKANVTQKDFKALKNLFLEKAGGYTEVPSTLGSSMHKGKAAPEERNSTFLVAAKGNISEDIKAFTAKHKVFERPFILVWRAMRQ